MYIKQTEPVPGCICKQCDSLRRELKAKNESFFADVRALMSSLEDSSEIFDNNNMTTIAVKSGKVKAVYPLRVEVDWENGSVSIIWSDETETHAKTQGDDPFVLEAGIAIAIVKKLTGNKEFARFVEMAETKSSKVNRLKKARKLRKLAESKYLDVMKLKYEAEKLFEEKKYK